MRAGGGGERPPSRLALRPAVGRSFPDAAREVLVATDASIVSNGASLSGGGVRFIDVHSGRGGWIASFDAVRLLVELVSRRDLIDAPGRRFPLLHVVGARRPLSGTECEALVWELARLRTLLSTIAAPAPVDAPSSPLWRRTLADVHDATIAALDRGARLGAASRRGARFEVLATSDVRPYADGTPHHDAD